MTPDCVFHLAFLGRVPRTIFDRMVQRRCLRQRDVELAKSFNAGNDFSRPQLRLLFTNGWRQRLNVGRYVQYITADCIETNGHGQFEINFLCGRRNKYLSKLLRVLKLSPISIVCACAHAEFDARPSRSYCQLAYLDGVDSTRAAWHFVCSSGPLPNRR